jgi:hypothetical protein
MIGATLCGGIGLYLLLSGTLSGLYAALLEQLVHLLAHG